MMPESRLLDGKFEHPFFRQVSRPLRPNLHSQKTLLVEALLVGWRTSGERHVPGRVSKGKTKSLKKWKKRKK